MIRNNLFYKLFALAVALALWTYVNAERNPQSSRPFTVPIQMINTDKGYVYELADSKVSITVSGLKTAVDSINREDISAVIDLDKIKESTNVPVSTLVEGATENLEIAVKPNKVSVKVEQLRSKRLPVEVKFLSAPPLGFSYSDPVITPVSASVSGKSTQVTRVKRIVVPLSNQDPHSPVDNDFPVRALDSSGNVVKDVVLSPELVHLKLEFVEVPATKAVIISPNVVGEPKFPARVSRVTVSPSSVTLEGKPSSLLDVSTLSTDAIVIEGEEKTVSKEVDIRVPAGMKVVGRKNVKVTVHISSPPNDSY